MSSQVARQQQVAAADRRRFLQRLDHELKNPLTALLAGLANLGFSADAPQQEKLTSTRLQVQRLQRLVGDLRKLSDLETAPLELSNINWTYLLEDMLTLAQEQAPDRELVLTIPRAPWHLD